MKITIESTEKIVTVNGVPARIWEGHTESGIAVHCFVTRIAVHESLDSTEFDKELQEHRKPSVDVAAYPKAIIL
jgi:hypothetical protein